MTEQNTAKASHPNVRRFNGAYVAIFISILAVVIIVGAFGYGYSQLTKMNIELTQWANDLQSRFTTSQSEIAVLQKSISELEQAAHKSQALSTQQEQVLSEWHAAQQGDLDKWHVAEAQYLVKLANDHLQFSHNNETALILLQQADKVLQNFQDAKILEIRKSIAVDIVNLQALPLIDITALYLRLIALNDQMDQLPLPTNPLKSEDKQNSATTIPSGLPWWKVGLEYAKQMLNKIVIVHYNGSNSLPLILPEEKNFLYQNLHAQMEDAIWGVLHQHAEIYQASLVRMAKWIQQYFVQDAKVTKTMLQQVDELRKVNVQPSVINLSNTLQFFDNYFSQAKAEQ